MRSWMIPKQQGNSRFSCHTCRDQTFKKSISPGVFRQFITHGVAGASCLCQFPTIPQVLQVWIQWAQANAIHRGVFVKAEEHRLAISSLRRGGIANKPDICSAVRFYLCYIGYKTNLPSDPERDAFLNFQGCLLWEHPWKTLLKKGCHKTCRNTMKYCFTTPFRMESSIISLVLGTVKLYHTRG